MKQEDVSALLHLKCAIVYGMGGGPANKNILKFNVELEILFCANDTNLLGKINILSVKEMEERLSWSPAMSLV